jgi:uncharacterized membrane protein YccF (DUF307 family)
VRDGLAAGATAAVLSGIPSTLITVVEGGDVVESTRAVGAVLVGRDNVLAGAAAHVLISLGWGVALERVLPRRRPVLAGAAAGLAIAGLDLGVVGRRLAPIRGLPLGRQVLDHAAFGAVVGAVLGRRQSIR